MCVWKVHLDATKEVEAASQGAAEDSAWAGVMDEGHVPVEARHNN